MKILNAEQVKKRMISNPETKLVMTLGPKAFAKCHIPGSINIYDIEVAKQQFSKGVDIIVYCSDQSCRASFYAYEQLEKAGYENIWRFAGGLREWSGAGYPLIESKTIKH